MRLENSQPIIWNEIGNAILSERPSSAKIVRKQTVMDFKTLETPAIGFEAFTHSPKALRVEERVPNDISIVNEIVDRRREDFIKQGTFFALVSDSAQKRPWLWGLTKTDCIAPVSHIPSPPGIHK
jgi:hypothetical protein